MAKFGSGSGVWRTLQKEGEGASVEGVISNIQFDKPSANPMYGKQTIITLETDEGAVNIPAPTKLAGIFKDNQGQLKVGVRVVVEYVGQALNKVGKPYHDFTVETVGAE